MNHDDNTCANSLTNEVDSIYLCDAMDRINNYFGSEYADEHPTRTAIVVLVAALESCIDTLVETIREAASTIGAQMENVSNDVGALVDSMDALVHTIEYK